MDKQDSDRSNQDGGRDISPTQEDEGEEDRTAKRQDGQGDQSGPRWHWTAVVGAINAALLTIVAVAGGYFGYMQLAEAIETNRITREQVYRGQRAYLILHGAKLDEPLAVGKVPTASVDLSNSGQTPALNASYDIGLTIAPTGCDSDLTVFGFQQPPPPSQPIAAGQVLKLRSFLLSPPLDANQIETITAEPFNVDSGLTIATPGPRLVLRAVVNYDHVFNGRGRTEFSAVYLNEQNGFVRCLSRNSME